MVVIYLEGVEGATLLPFMQCRWRLLILPWVRAITGKVTGSATVVTDDLASRSLLVITIGAWWQDGEISGVLSWSVLPLWVSSPIQQSAAIIAHFLLQLQGKHHYIMDLWGGHGPLLGLDKLTNVWLQTIYKSAHLVHLR